MKRTVVGLLVASSLVAGVVEARAQSGSEGAAQRPAQAEPPPETLVEALRRMHVSVGTEIVSTSAYIWRGFIPTDAFSVQPNTWVKFGNLTLSSWSNMAGQSVGGLLTEHDLTVDYSQAVGRFTVTGGWINYVFPPAETGRHSNEIYGGLSHASYLNPTVRVYQDVHEGSGTYVNFAVSHEFEAAGGLKVTPSAALGYNHHQWVDASTFSDASFGLKVKVPTPVKHLAVAPFVTYSRSLAQDHFPSRLYGGFGIVIQ